MILVTTRCDNPRCTWSNQDLEGPATTNGRYYCLNCHHTLRVIRTREGVALPRLTWLEHRRNAWGETDDGVPF